MQIISLALQRVHEPVHLHRHPYHEVHYLVSGHGMFECDGRQEKICAGTFFFTRPNVEHRIIPKGGSIIKYGVHVRFDEDSEMQVLVDDLLARRRFQDIGMSHRFFFEGIRVRFTSANIHLSLAAKHQFTAFLHTLASGVSPSDSDRAATVLEPVLQIMQERLDQKLSLQKLCAETGISRRTLIRLFNHHMGIPPMKFLSRMRVDAACHLLNTSSMTLAEIAEDLGFADEFHFSKVFKRWVGMPPSRYRQTNG